MPTRRGITTLVVAIVAVVVGRVFGVIELYIIAVSMAALAIGAWAFVALWNPPIRVERSLRPSVMTVGMAGRGELEITNDGPRRTPVTTFIEPIGTHASATVEVGSMSSGDHVSASYRIPTERRGAVTIGPMLVERHDPFRLARRTAAGTGQDVAYVAPVAYRLAMPRFGSGPLGRHLVAVARRLGPGDFHSLRDYVEGDEMRSVHWKASARSDVLKVRQHEPQRLTHISVVLDPTAHAYQNEPLSDHDQDWNDGFERALTVAASLVASSAAAELHTRLWVPPSLDLRGPTVASATLRALAEITPADTQVETVDVPPFVDDGLGLVVYVTASPTSPILHNRHQTGPATTTITVLTNGAADRWSSVQATSVERFLAGWGDLVGDRSSAADSVFSADADIFIGTDLGTNEAVPV